MLQAEYPLYLANGAIKPNLDLAVYDKYSGALAARAPAADDSLINEAITWAVQAAKPMRELASYQRADTLRHCVHRFRERFEELAYTLCVEAGKPIRDARGEVMRLIDTFNIAAEETVRWGGEYMPLDISPRAAGYEAVYKRFPLGPCSFITPFNFPLNLVAHKVAPAIAAGCPFILKPASWTPIGALIIGEILSETDLPQGAFSILPCPGERAGLFAADERLKLLSFTGSPEVGWALKAKAGKKKVALELGGNAGCIVDEGADVDYAAGRITIGAFYQSGQSCISVQRVLAHRSLYKKLEETLVEQANSLKMGDPKEESTFIGPMISEGEAVRVEQWVQEAVANGAKILCGGERQGAFYPATWLTDVNPKDKVSSREVFAPVAIIRPFDDFKQAVEEVNDSIYGLQAGVFTDNLQHAFYAWKELEVGGVVIGDIPSMRVDNMPYGGVKNSGLGREGVRFAMEEMSEIKLMMLNKAGFRI